MTFIHQTGLFGLLLFTVACVPAPQETIEDSVSTKTMTMKDNQLTTAEREAGWKLLFDGESTDGWRVYQRQVVQGWAIEDGQLIALGQPGEDGHSNDIITENEYENFELQLDWKISEKGNSGIFFNVVESDAYQAVYETGPEYQLLDDERYLPEIEDWQRTGANYAMHPPLENAAKPQGQYNHSRVLVINGRVHLWLNGVKTAEYELWTPEWEALVKAGKWKDYPGYGRAKRGHIALQDHGNKIWFKNIKIREFEATNLFNREDLSGWEIYGTEKWFVEDGELICESGPDKGYGYLATDQSFKDMDLSLEFKQEANGNSGVFFRSSIEGTKITGWQAEVAPPGSNTGGIYESYGRGWLIQPDSTLDTALKMGEWNLMRVQVVGDEVITWLNGQQMIQLQDEKIGQAEGQIALQIHDGGGIKVRWRNIKVFQPKK